MFSIFTFHEIDEWNRIVKQFKHYDVYYLAEYTNAFKIHGDGEPLLFYFEDENIRAMNVVMKRDIEKDERFKGKILPSTFFDLSTPYGYGGFLVEGNRNEESLKTLETEYSSFCKKEGFISEFVRFHPVLNNAGDLHDIYDITKLGKTITMFLEKQEDIWKSLNTNKKRWIKKAKDSGVEIYWGRNPQLFYEFQDMYNMTMGKNQAQNYYYFNDDFFRSVLDDLRYNSMIFYAVYEGKKIAMVLVLHGNGQLHHHLSASDLEFQHLASTNLLMYEVACWGSENGYNTFHLGGGVGSREDNLLKFKSGFNKQSNTIFTIGKKIFNQARYDELVKIRRNDESFSETELFFPKYRS